jgi:hypothetical protein
MLGFKTFDKAVSLPKLDGMTFNEALRNPPRLIVIGARKINAFIDAAVWPNDVGPIVFH